MLFTELMESLDPESNSFVVRPPTDSAGLGIARIANPTDLSTYAAALAEAVPRLPPGSLSQQQGVLTLPLEPPAVLVAEPWVEVEACEVGVGADGGLEVTWAGSSSRWLEVSIGLMGELVSGCCWWGTGGVPAGGQWTACDASSIHSTASCKLHPARTGRASGECSGVGCRRWTACASLHSRHHQRTREGTQCSALIVSVMCAPLGVMFQEDTQCSALLLCVLPCVCCLSCCRAAWRRCRCPSSPTLLTAADIQSRRHRPTSCRQAA